MRPFLTNKILDEELSVNGYTVINFFNDEETRLLRSLNKKLTKPYPGTGLNFSFHHADSEKLAENDREFRAAFETSIMDHFLDCTLFGSGFINKGIGIRNAVPYHQDWTIVREEDTSAIACWVPLQDTGPYSGSITVIPRSHTLKTGVRTLNHPTITIDLHDKNIAAHTKTINLSAGQGIVYFPRLFHGTHPNNTLWIRRTLVLTLLPKETTSYFYYLNESQTAYNIYLLPSDFHLNYKKYILENGFRNFAPVGTEPVHKQADKQEIIRGIQSLG